MSDTPQPPRVQRHDDTPAFRHAAGTLLASDEVRHALPLAILTDVEQGTWQRAHLTTVHRGDAVTLAAIRTPPYDLVLTSCTDTASIDALAETMHASDDAENLAGVVGPEAVASRFAATWANHADVTTTSVRHGVYALHTVRETPAREATLRVATPGDAAMLRTWFDGFAREVAIKNPEDSHTLVERWLSGHGRTLYLLDAYGTAVAMTGVTHATPGIARITAVYTPPHQRGRGNATTLVAKVTSTVLREGARYATLYTDADNPTSNAIYRRIGYRLVGIDVHVQFVPTVTQRTDA